MATATGASDGGGRNASASKAARRRSSTPSYSGGFSNSSLPFSPGDGGALPF